MYKIEWPIVLVVSPHKLDRHVYKRFLFDFTTAENITRQCLHSQLILIGYTVSAVVISV